MYSTRRTRPAQSVTTYCNRLAYWKCEKIYGICLYLKFLCRTKRDGHEPTLMQPCVRQPYYTFFIENCQNMPENCGHGCAQFKIMWFSVSALKTTQFTRIASTVLWQDAHLSVLTFVIGCRRCLWLTKVGTPPPLATRELRCFVA